MNSKISVALAGNPNSGKTTLFNGLTGARQYVGNWAGVTVEKKEGLVKHKGNDIKITDLPGTYSLSPFSIEEVIARNYIVDESPDVIINIVDASNIERNLYLTVQLMELEKPMIIALNMMDVAEKRGYAIDAAKLSKELGIPVVPIIASKRKGLDKLIEAALELYKGNIEFSPRKITYSKDIENRIEEIASKIEESSTGKKLNNRWLGLKLLEGDELILKHLNIESRSEEAASFDGEINNDSVESRIADCRYKFINDIVKSSVVKGKDEDNTISDKIDAIVTNKWLGLPIFALIMYGVFYFTFDLVGNRLLDVIDVFFSEVVPGWATFGLEAIGVSPWLISLIVDGIIGGVGGVLVFLPNIACLFIAISILEDSGYMARVAFIMDRGMRKIGLSGKAFIPMILGFGCNVPAIMSTRTLEDENDRMTTILVNPFMSCSARLPVYTLFAGVFFPRNQQTVVFSLYLLGIVVAVIVALIFKKTLFKGEETPFIMELPPYRIPTIRGISITVWDRIRGFIVRAGTLIFGASIVLWFILNYNFTGAVPINESIGAFIGKIVAPIFAPLGFGNWQSALSLITGVIAKEVVVSNMMIIYGIGEGAAEATKVLFQNFSQLSAYAFMVFVLLYTPCVATIAVIKKETNSWKWTGFSVIYQAAVAWIVAFIVYQIGSLIIF